MKKTKQLSMRFSATMLFTIAVLLLSCMLPAALTAQSYWVVNPQTATCQISLITKVIESGGAMSKGANKANSNTKEVIKTYKPVLNQLGYFNQIYKVQPLQNVAVEITYPEGKAGDKIALMAADGGGFENKEKVKVMQLSSQKKLSFNFQVAADAGMYRIMSKKGNDIKVIQLWVGPEMPLAKQ